MSGRGRGGDATNRGLRSSRILLAVLLVAGAAACSSDDDEAAPAATTSPPVPEAGEPVTVGDLELTPCEDLEDIWCGTIEVPQDREDDSSDETLTVGFEWYPRADPGPAEGLLVARRDGVAGRNGEGTRWCSPTSASPRRRRPRRRSPSPLRMSEMSFCTGCGRPVDSCEGGCTRTLDPPRFCPVCGRRSRVDVTPTGYESRCRDHGTFKKG